jgi:hypothetical protein
MKLTSFTRFLSALTVAAFVSINTGCTPAPSKLVQSNLTATVAGRTITASIPGPAVIQPDENGAIISTNAHKITVESERVLLDGTEFVKLPATATKVKVAISDYGILSVEADGNQVGTKQLPK